MNKRYGKMVKIMLLSLIGIMILSSCFPTGNGKSIPPDGEDEIAEARTKAVLEAVEQKDKEALKAMFSQKAISESDNLDENIEYLFTVVQGEVKSWERQGTSLGGENRYGDKKEYINAFFDFTTNKGEYVIHFVDYIRDDSDAGGIGLYFISIIKLEDEQKDWGIWNGLDKPGVYKPEKE